MRFLLILAAVLQLQAPAEYDHVFFDNSLIPTDWFYSEVASEGGSYVYNIRKRLPVTDDEFFTGGNALLLQTNDAKDGHWKVTLRFPEWRGKDRIADGSTLFMYIKPGSASKVVDLPYVAFDRSFHVDASKYATRIAQQGWYKVEIPLTDLMGDNIDVSLLKNLHLMQRLNDGRERTFYLDQVEILSNKYPVCKVHSLFTRAESYERHTDVFFHPVDDPGARYVALYRSADGGKTYRQVAIQDPTVGIITDYHGKPGVQLHYLAAVLDGHYEVVTVSKPMRVESRYMTDEELLTMVQRASIRYAWEGAEPISGLSLENKPGRRHMVATGASGWGIMAIISGVEEGYIPRKAAAERMEQIVGFLEKAETFHGAYPHFIDATTGKVEPFFGMRDNGADLVETSFLFAGLLTARNYFTKGAEQKRIADRITRLWERIEWDWFRQTPGSPYLYWHWSPDQEWVINHKLIGWNETMITYLLAIASPTHGVPAEMYYSGWASQSDYAKEYRSGWGETHDGETYSNGQTFYGVPLEVGVNCGGPLFFTHFSFMGLNPHGLRDRYCSDYYENLRNITLINYRYCLNNPNNRVGYGPECWGLNVCENPWGSYGAYEAVPHHEDGTMTPSGALGAFPYLPEEAMTALKNYYRNYGKWLWREYGFYDSFHLGEGWTSNIWMGLDQGAIPVMIENYRKGTIWKYFGMDKDVQRMRREVFEP